MRTFFKALNLVNSLNGHEVKNSGGPLTMLLISMSLLTACGDDMTEGTAKITGKSDEKSLTVEKKHPEKNPADQKAPGMPLDSAKKEYSKQVPDGSPKDEIVHGLPDDIELYRQEYEKATDLDDKIEAMASLVQADEDNAMSLLREAYQSPEAEMRKEVVLQLQDLSENPEALDLLLVTLDDPDPEVVMEALDALSSVDDPQAEAALADIAQSHPDESVRETAKDFLE